MIQTNTKSNELNITEEKKHKMIDIFIYFKSFSRRYFKNKMFSRLTKFFIELLFFHFIKINRKHLLSMKYYNNCWDMFETSIFSIENKNFILAKHNPLSKCFPCHWLSQLCFITFTKEDVKRTGKKMRS